MIEPSGYGSLPSRKALNATSLPKTAPKLLRLPASCAEEIHCQLRYPWGISVTKGAGSPSACPGAGPTRATSPAMVATAIKKNVKCFMTVPPKFVVPIRFGIPANLIPTPLGLDLRLMDARTHHGMQCFWLLRKARTQVTRLE